MWFQIVMRQHFTDGSDTLHRVPNTTIDGHQTMQVGRVQTKYQLLSATWLQVLNPGFCGELRELKS